MPVKADINKDEYFLTTEFLYLIGLISIIKNPEIRKNKKTKHKKVKYFIPINNILPFFFVNLQKKQFMLRWHLSIYFSVLIACNIIFTDLSYSQVDTLPDDLPGLKLWLKADSASTVHTSGSDVTQWDDCSGNGYIVTQAAPSSQPTIQYGIINGNPVIRFDGSDDLNGGDILDMHLHSYDIYVISKANSNAGGIITKYHNLDNSIYALGLYSGQLYYSFYGNHLVVNHNPGAFKIYNAKSSRQDLQNKLFINNVNTGVTTNISNIDMDGSANFKVGGADAVFGQLDGDIAEIVIYDTILTVNQQNALINYFQFKYGGPPVSLGPDTVINNSFCAITLDAGSGYNSYLWSTGETIQIIQVDSSATYSVTVTDIFDLPLSDEISVTFPSINLTDTFFCSESYVTLSTGLGGGYTYYWSTTETTSTIDVYTEDYYSVTITDGSSCTVSSNTIYVNCDSFPTTASLGPDNSLCVGNTIELIAPSPLPQINNYFWSTTESTSSIAVDYPGGDYSLTVTDANGCSARDTINIFISGTAPDVHFTAITGCSGNITQFQNESNPPGTAWDWNFNDGSPHSNDTNPIHVFTSGNDYNIELTVYDGLCSNYQDSIIHIAQSPFAEFTTDTLCEDNPYTFYDQSIPNEGNVILWYWDFGDGNHSHAKDTTYSFDSAGTYNVMHIVQTDYGCIDTVIKSVNVVSTAIAPFAFSLYMPSDSLVTNNNIIDFAWNISPGAIRYTLQYSPDSLFINNVTDIQNLVTESAQQAISGFQTFYWRVIAYGICGDSILSNKFTFSLFSPDSLSDLVLWLRADLPSTVHTSGSDVTQWDDCSMNAYSFTQGLSSSQPILQNNPALINGKPYIHFDGLDDFLNGGDILDMLMNSFDIYIIAKANTAKGSIISKYDNTDNNIYAFAFYTNQLYYSFYSNHLIVNDSPGLFKIYNPKSSRPNLQNSVLINRNNTGVYTSITNTNMDGNQNFKIGGADAVFTPFDGDIAEIIIYNNILNNNNRKIIEKYFDYKYGAIVNLGPDIWSYNLCADTLDASDRFTSYLWNTGDTTSSIIVNSGGTYSVTATDIFGFLSTDDVVVNKPIVNTHGDTLCLGDSTTLHSGLSSPYTTAWAWANDTTWNEAYTIHSGDTVDLVLKDTIGCTAVKQIVMSSDNFPLTDLLGASSLTKCADDTIFAAQDTGQYVTYNWFDGTNNYSTPYYIVPASWVGPGNGTLTLTCSNARGCTATDVVTVGVPGYMPEAGFTATAGCEPFLTQFTDTSVVLGTGASADQWIWDFGDGGNSTQQNPSHQFDTAGVHLVSLYVHTNKGCDAIVVDTAFVYSKPDVAFSPLLGCTGQELQFNDHSTSILGDVDSWTWYFNDPYSSNNTSTLQNPKHTYDSVGYYWVVLLDTTEYGCTSLDSQKIFIRPSPAVDFSYTNVCDGNPVYFTNLTQDPLGFISQLWDFGNGNTTTTYNPVFTFDSAGTYDVILIVQSINGCIVNDTQQVVVHALPDAYLEPPDDICLGYPETLSDSSTVLYPDSVTLWEWDFGTLGTFYGEHPSIDFPAEGDYPVTLTVITNAGCSGIYTTSVHVNPVPTALFSPDEFYGESPDTIIFTNNSQDGWNYFWDFNDGSTYSTFSLADLNHIFTYNDTFNVVLIVTNSYGCTDTTSTLLFITPTTADVAVQNVTTQKQGDFLSVSADIANFGTRRIYELYLYAKTSGGTMFMESWSNFTHPLQPDSVMPYTFNAQFALPEGQSLDYVCVEAQIKNTIPDDDPSNNEECVTFNKNFTAFIPYPSPTHDVMSLDYILPFKDQVNIDLYDVRGRLVKHIFDGEGQKGLNKLTVDLTDLALSVYLYRIDFNDDFRILRFVKY